MKKVKQKSPDPQVWRFLHANYISKGERCDRRRWREKGAERVAAVDKIEEKREPEDFIGHRNRGQSNNAKGVVHLNGTRSFANMPLCAVAI